jgi:hypothetical protein
MILSLDISTSITGITLMEDYKIIVNDIVDTRNKEKFVHLNDVANAIKRKILSLVGNNKIDSIIVEEPLNKFRSGQSSANTLSTLSKINGIVCYICEETFGIRPELIAAISARKTAGLKIEKKSDLDTKDQVLKFVKENYNFEYLKTKAGNPKPGTYDRADSIVLALAAQKMLDGPTTNE